MAFKYKTVDVDVEIDLDDVISYIKYDATEAELKRIAVMVKADVAEFIPTTVADEMKYKFIMDNFNKFSLEELEERFNETYIP